MRGLVRSYFVLALVSFAGNSAWAEGWKMPDLNPFDNNTTQPISRGAESKSWMPGWKNNTLSNAGSTMWKKTQAAPGNLMNGTKRAVNAVNPFKGSTSTTHSRPLTGSNLDKQPPAKKWLPSWGSSDTANEQGPPQTVSDFIAGPRPE
jgi:hypothetical protein